MKHGKTRWRGFIVDPVNAPLPRAGVYGFENIVTGKWYIGLSQNLLRRSLSHADITAGDGKFVRTLRKYGTDKFRLIPLFYLLDQTHRETLYEVETNTIRQLDSIRNGYNVVELDPSAVYGYGPEHAQLVRNSHARPDVKARTLAINREIISRPEVRQKLSEAVRVAYENPAIHADISAKVTASWQNPEVIARHRAARATQKFKAGVIATLQGETATKNRLAKFRTQEHREAVGRWMHTPEVQAKRNATLRDPELQRKKAIKQRATFADPAYKARLSAIQKEINSRPEVRAKRSASAKAAWERRRKELDALRALIRLPIVD